MCFSFIALSICVTQLVVQILSSVGAQPCLLLCVMRGYANKERGEGSLRPTSQLTNSDFSASNENPPVTRISLEAHMPEALVG